MERGVFEEEGVGERDCFPVDVCAPLFDDVTDDVPEFVQVEVRLEEVVEDAVDVPP